VDLTLIIWLTNEAHFFFELYMLVTAITSLL